MSSKCQSYYFYFIKYTIDIFKILYQSIEIKYRKYNVNKYNSKFYILLIELTQRLKGVEFPYNIIKIEYKNGLN